MMKEWINIKGIGNLYLESILVTFDVPLLFVCKTKDNNRYLVLSEDEREYLVSKCSDKMLLDMLQNKTPMDKVFMDSDENILIQIDSKENECVGKVIDRKDLHAGMLPDKGAYFESNNDNIKEYVDRVSNVQSSFYDRRKA